MKRLATLAAAALFAAGCSSAPPEPLLAPVPVAAPDTVAPDVRDAMQNLAVPDSRADAAARLLSIGRNPGRQGEVVTSLRAAATSTDPALRSEARRVLRELERRDLQGGDAQKFSISSESEKESHTLAFVVRFYADGSVEGEIAADGASAELFAARTWDEWRACVEAAARARGYEADRFSIAADGRVTFLGLSTSALPDPRKHLVPGWQLWVNRLGEEGFHSREAVSGWEITAAGWSGRGRASGLRIGDVILGADDAPTPESPEALGAELDKAGAARMVRLREVDLKVGPR
ncbi:MAG: hypothetical protein AAB074_02900 [Planctomycetota bacterium]